MKDRHKLLDDNDITSSINHDQYKTIYLLLLLRVLQHKTKHVGYYIFTKCLP